MTDIGIAFKSQTILKEEIPDFDSMKGFIPVEGSENLRYFSISNKNYLNKSTANIIY